MQDKARGVGFDWENRNDVWDKVREEFDELHYELQNNNPENAEKELTEIKIEDEISDIVCDLCGKNMVIREGRFGRFLE